MLLGSFSKRRIWIVGKYKGFIRMLRIIRGPRLLVAILEMMISFRPRNLGRL